MKSLNDSSYIFVFLRMEKNRITSFSLAFTSLRFRWFCALCTAHLYCWLLQLVNRVERLWVCSMRPAFGIEMRKTPSLRRQIIISGAYSYNRAFPWLRSKCIVSVIFVCFFFRVVIGFSVLTLTINNILRLQDRSGWKFPSQLLTTQQATSTLSNMLKHMQTVGSP